MFTSHFIFFTMKFDLARVFPPRSKVGMKIVHYPHPSLRHPGRPLTAIDKKVRLLVGEMLDLMYEAKGLGLAAPQVCLPYQVLVMNHTADANQRDKEGIYINPVILERHGSVEGEEGCLSFPGLYGKVRRAKTVTVRAYDLQGRSFDVTAMELQGRVLQHEIDHLQGNLFIDKMGSVAKLSARGAIQEFERDYKRAQERGDVPPDKEIEQLLVALEAEA
jgi:peptide deformylase